jgi:hypothetical protein
MMLVEQDVREFLWLRSPIEPRKSIDKPFRVVLGVVFEMQRRDSEGNLDSYLLGNSQRLWHTRKSSSQKVYPYPSDSGRIG